MVGSDSAELKIKGSKFISFATYCSSEEKAKEILKNLWSEHNQATHICYAYRMGFNGEKYRANDDGEPNNSAGAPILGQIDSFGLTFVLVAVIRYYGGTKLGVGGLIGAYKEAAKEVLEVSAIEEIELKKHVQLNMNYEDMPHVMSVLKRHQLEIIRNDLTESCEIELKLDLEDCPDLAELLVGYESVKIKDLGEK